MSELEFLLGPVDGLLVGLHDLVDFLGQSEAIGSSTAFQEQALEFLFEVLQVVLGHSPSEVGGCPIVIVIIEEVLVHETAVFLQILLLGCHCQVFASQFDLRQQPVELVLCLYFLERDAYFLL